MRPRSSTPRRRRQPTFLIDQLEERRLLSLAINVQLDSANPSSNDPASVINDNTISNPKVGDVYNLQVWAEVHGANSTGTDDSFTLAFGSLLSANIGTGSVRGTLSVPTLEPDFILTGAGASGSGAGAQNDLDGDGDLDIGGTNPKNADGYFNPFNNSGNQPPRTLIGEGSPGAGAEFELATLTFTVTSITNGPPTNLEFQLRDTNTTATSLWSEDGPTNIKYTGTGANATDSPGKVVSITVPDTIPPTASVSNLAPMIGGSKSYQFTVNYSDNQDLNTSTINSNDILVTGPNGYSQLATLVSKADAAPSSTPQYDPWTATYEIQAPDQTNGWGGATGIADNGAYSFALQPNQLADNTGNVAPGATLGTVNLDITGAVSISPPSASVNESSTTPATFTVTRTDLVGGNFAEPMTVNYTLGGSAVAGTNYNVTDAAGDPAGTLTIPAGQSSATITVQPIDDNIVDNDSNLTLTINQGNQYIISGNATSTLDIVDTDRVAASVANLAISRSTADQTVNFTVTVSGNFNIPVYVDYSTSDGTATAGVDYTSASGVLEFDPGQSLTQTVPVTVLSSTNSGDRTFDFNIAADAQSTGKVTIAQSPGVGTIQDIIPATVGGNITVTSGLEGGVALFTVNLATAPATPVSVNYSTADGTAVAGTDYTATSGVLNFAAGQSTATVSVPLLAIVRSNAGKSFSLNITPGTRTSVSAGTDSATATFLTPNFNGVTIDPKKGVTYIDAAGNKIKVKITNGATGYILFPTGGPTTGVNPAGIVVDGSSTKSNLTINGKPTSMDFIDVAGSVKTLNGKGVTLNQYLKTTGTVNSLTVANLNSSNVNVSSLKTLKAGNLTNSNISIGAGPSTSLKLAAVKDSTINDLSAIKSLNTASWLNTDSTADTLNAASVNKLNSKGDFEANVTTGLIGTIQIKGAWNNSLVTATQVKTMHVGTSSGSKLLAAVSNEPVFPNTPSDFAAGGQISNFAVTSKSAGAFSNTVIAAGAIGTVSLGSVGVTNAAMQFGVAAQSIKSVTGSTSSGKFSKKNVSNTNPGTPLISDQDFVVLLV